MSYPKKATLLEEIDQAVVFNEPVGPDHPFYTDFSTVRGDFEESRVYKILNVSRKNGKFTFDTSNSRNKTLFFLGGMRGTGKTSELAKYVKNLHRPECFFCVTCNVDEELDMNDVEYMDILVFQLEKLISLLDKAGVNVDEGILKKFEKWFQTRETEIKKSLKAEAGVEFGLESSSPSLLKAILSITGKFKLGFTGSKERATVIRTTLKNRFPEFAQLFNIFIEEVNLSLRQSKAGQEVLFVVDGLEKTMSVETRRKIVIEESNRLRQIKAYTIFTLPIELMRERQKIAQFSTVEAFPFVKLLHRQGQQIKGAIDTFKEFVYKRIDVSLFENETVVEKAILHGGGSPRELLRILENASFQADESKGMIDEQSLDKALTRLGNQTAQYLTDEKLSKLKEISENNKNSLDTPFDDIIQEMLEDIIVMEYNDGSYKRVNPVVELSNLYRQYVGN